MSNERRQAVLARVRSALDAFYMLQRIDWDYDIKEALEKILELAVKELKFSGDLEVRRAMIVLREQDRSLAFHAGWFNENQVVRYSSTVVEDVLNTGQPVFCFDSGSDSRFNTGHSVRIKRLESFACLPIDIQGTRVGALFLDTTGSTRQFESEDTQFLAEFVSIISPYIKTALFHQLHLEELQERHAPVFWGQVGKSGRMQQLFDQIRLLAKTEATVLITGDTGTGKSLVARAIHQTSDRAEEPLLIVDCASQSAEDAELELFGTEARDGALLRADGGVVLLDEVAEIGPQVQAKLLRFLQDQEFRPVDSEKVLSVDVRVLASTNRDLRKRVEQGSFRQDLYFRINVLQIQTPALRERLDDIPDLVAHFIKQINENNSKQVTEVTADALSALRRHRWDGNVRQLEHTIARAALFAKGEQIRLEDLPEEVRSTGPSMAELGFQRTLEEVRRELGESGEKEYVERALEQVKDQAEGRVDLVEKALQLIPECSASTLRRRIKLLEIDLSRFAAKQTGRKR